MNLVSLPNNEHIFDDNLHPAVGTFHSPIGSGFAGWATAARSALIASLRFNLGFHFSTLRCHARNFVAGVYRPVLTSRPAA